MEKVKIIQIHCNDFVLCVVTLQLNSNNPLYRLLKYTLQSRMCPLSIKLLSQLLSDSRTATSTFLTKDPTLNNSTSQGVKVNTRMLIETHILSGHQGINQCRRELGIIDKDDEAKGGNALEINAGLVFDTRDMEAAPNKGIWAEAYLNGNVLQHQYLKACMYFRHYIDIPIHIPAGDPVFAYRLAWQQTLAGETPLYMIQNVPLLVQRNMISEGFGSSNTIRGIRENRILTEGFAWANTELRIKLVKFKLFNQYFYVAVNPFFDAGIITKPYRAAAFEKVAVDGKVYDPKLAALGQETLIYDSSKVKDVIMSAGAGLKIAMNQNFIVSAEFAKCLYKPLDAGLWIGIGINYQF